MQTIVLRLFLTIPLVTLLALFAEPVPAGAKRQNSATSPMTMAAQRYAQAVAGADRQAVGQLDFACLYRMVTARKERLKSFPPPADPIYTACWDQLVETHKGAVAYRDQGMEVLWPGKGSLVFFGEDLSRYPASAFVMDLLGLSPPAGGLRVELVESRPLPAGSFKLQDDGSILAATATLVRLRILYKDPLTAPVTYSEDAYRWTNTVKRPRQALKAVTVQWTVLSGLKQLGFPSDVAVVNLPVKPAQKGDDGTSQAAVPFLTERSGYVPKSAAWWQPEDAPGILLAAIGRAAQFPDQRDRLAMLNRVLIVDPRQPEALTVLTRDLYDTIVSTAATSHKLSIPDPTLAARFNELYWDVYAQTWRMDLSLGMEMGGLNKPTPADYLYRLIPAMEKLAEVRPDNIQNRLRLGTAYRWNNDQMAAIEIHEKLVAEIPTARSAIRSEALIELAMSRIARVSWNRTFDDPGILQAYKEAEEALTLTDDPLDKFAAAYTMAYSLAFTPHRDNHAMLSHLQEAQRWYMQLAGASQESWRYLLANDTLKGVIEADPALKPLLAAS
jgi:hypothetical protein